MNSNFRLLWLSLAGLIILSGCDSKDQQPEAQAGPIQQEEGIGVSPERQEQIDAELGRFTSNPQTFMNEVPFKTDPQTGLGAPVEVAEYFDLEDNQYVLQKSHWREATNASTEAEPPSDPINKFQVILTPESFPEQPTIYQTLCLSENETFGISAEADTEEANCVVSFGDVADLMEQEGLISGRARIRSNDLARNLVDDLRWTTLEEMERAGAFSAAVPTPAWSDDYWPIYSGVLGKRYTDSNLERFSTNWTDRKEYSLNENPASVLIGQDRQNHLSPAEKYDLLIESSEFSFTQNNWAQGQRYLNRDGTIEAWMGICHGWAPAAYMLARPTHPVTYNISGKELTFYPSDIKSLASYLWAKRSPGSRFIGGRCNDKDPDRDEQTGRVTSNKCFDTNPGTWHLAVVNQIGFTAQQPDKGHRTFIMDATYDYEVWNQPIKSYSYSYFNPQTRQSVQTLAQARVSRSQFTNDPFTEHRGPNYTHAVGIAMEVEYIIETAPTQTYPDSENKDGVRKVIYFYDLELRNGEITGGEWYQNAHPDFLWTPRPGARALTKGDRGLPKWNGTQPLSSRFKQRARENANQGLPLAEIVEGLIEAAQ